MLLEKVKKEPIKMITAMIDSTERVIASRSHRWRRYRRKYRRGLYYLQGDSPSHKPLYFTNYIFAIVEVLKAHLTRNLPMTSIRARGNEGDQAAADLIGRIVRSELLSAGIKRKTQVAVQHAVITGIGWFKVGLDPSLNRGEGGVAVDGLAPEDVLIDPLAQERKDARWIIHVHRDVPHEKIYATYGKLPKETDGDTEHRGYGERSRSAAEVSAVSDVYECWIQDFKAENDEPRWYIITLAGKTILRELAPSIYTHNQMPFVPVFDGEDPSAENLYFRGVGEVEQIEPLQDRADALDQRIYQAICRVTNRQKFVSSQSGLNINLMTEHDGHTYQINGDPSKAVWYDNPPPLSREVYIYRDATEQLIQVVSGMFDALQGRRPVGIVAGKAVQSLQEAAATRVLFKVDSLAETIKEVFNLSIQIVLQFYDTERLIRLTDATENQVVRVLGEYPDAILQDGSEEAKMQFKMENGIDLVLADVNFDYDIEVDADSALPQSRVDRAQTALDLFRLGAIDRKAVLDALDYPNRHEILRRLAQEVTGKSAGDPMAEGQAMNEFLAMLGQQQPTDTTPPQVAY